MGDSREQVLAWMQNQVWAMHQPTLTTILSAVERAAGPMEAATPPRRSGQASRLADGTVGVIPILGPIAYRPNLFTRFFGGSTVQEIEAELRELVESDVSAIVLDVDSPGGVADGVLELTETIRKARLQKPIIALANTFMASAAYWIGSAATAVLMMRSGEVGSIGVFTLHLDFSRMLDRDGVTPTFIFAGSRKVDANRFQPLSDRAKADVQERINGVYDTFVRGVAKGRGQRLQKVQRYADGRMFSPADALSLGLVDNFGDLSSAIGRGRTLGTTMATRRDQDHLRLALARYRPIRRTQGDRDFEQIQRALARVARVRSRSAV